MFTTAVVEAYCPPAVPAQLTINNYSIKVQRNATSTSATTDRRSNKTDVASMRWNALVAVAQQCEKSGLSDIAEPIWFHALDCCKNFGVRDSRVADTIRSVADCLFKSGELERAEPYFLLEARLSHLVYGGKHIQSANSLSRLGHMYYAQKSYPAAKLCFTNALKTCVAVCGEESEQTMRASQTLAVLLNALGEKDKARMYFRAAIKISCKLLGPSNSSTMVLLNQLLAVSSKSPIKV